MHVRHALAVAEAQRLKGAHVALVAREPAVVFRQLGERAAVSFVDVEEALEELRRFGPPLDGEEVDDLYEQARAAKAFAPDGLDQLTQAGDEAVVADAQERPRRDVADARGLDDNRAGPARGEAPVPLKVLARHDAVLGRPPGNHGRNPRAALKHQRADPDGLKQARARGLVLVRPARLRYRVPDGGFGVPHDCASVTNFRFWIRSRRRSAVSFQLKTPS